MNELKERIPEAGKNFRNLVMAPSSKADTYAEEVHTIMCAVGLGKRYFISDESTFSDLPVDDFESLSDQLGGMPISPADYVADIAELMAQNKK